MSGFKRKKKEERDLVSEYFTRFVQGGAGKWRPESSLPATKSEIKKAILAEAVVNISDPACLDALRNGYVLLSHFVEDELAEQLQRFWLVSRNQTLKARSFPHQLQEHELDELANHLGEIDTDMVKRHGEEGRRLPAEFDDIVDRLRRLFDT